IGCRVQFILDRLQFSADISDNAPARMWEALGIGIFFAIIDDPRLEIEFMGQPCDCLSNMTAADDQQSNAWSRGQNRKAVDHTRTSRSISKRWLIGISQRRDQLAVSIV